MPVRSRRRSNLRSFYYKLRLAVPVRKPLAMLAVTSGYLRAKLSRKPRLRGVDIVTNYSCNLRCSHCNIEPMTRKGEPTLSLDDYRAVERQCSELGVFQYTFTGGEPLVCKDLEEIIEVFKPHKRLIFLQTNGRLISSLEKARWLRRIGVDVVNVSLDSGLPDEHDANRNRPGNYAETMRALDFVRRAGLRTMIGTVLTHQNLHSRGIHELLEHCERNRILLVLNLAAPVGRWHDNEDILLTEEDQDHIRGLTARYPMASLDIEAAINAYGCPGFKEKLYITPYGEVTGCTFVQVSFGNVKESPLRRIRDRALESGFMSDFSPRCYAAEDRDFMRRTMPHLGGNVPRRHSELLEISPGDG